MAVAVKPSKSLLNIRSGIKSIKDSFSGLRKNSENLNEVVLKKTKVKRESIARNYILSQRRKEEERRKNKEDLLEASSIGGAVKRQAKVIASSAKGFLGRIMDFLGTLLVGWLLTNLPSIITMAQELIARIQRLYTIVTGFFDNTIKLFRGFGNLLGAVGKNILTFDFTDSKGRVESALKDLGGTFDDMQSQFDEGFKLLTTSLGEGVVSGENAQPFGTQYENESMQEQPAPSGGTSGGGNLSTTQKQALNILSKYESAGAGGYNAVNQIGIRGGRGVMGYSGDFTRMPQHGGRPLTDLTIAEIMALQAKRPGMSNQEWIRQGRLHAVGRYQFIGGTLPGVVKRSGIPINAKFTPEVQDLLALQYLKEAGIGAWIGPSDKATREERMVIERARKEPINYKPPISSGSSQQQSQIPSTPRPAQTSPSPSTPVPNQSMLPKLPPTDTLGGGVQRYGASRRGGRRHAGTDFDISGNQKFYSRIGGVVTKIGYDPGGYGNYIDIYNAQLGVYERIAEAAKILVREGQTIQPGQAVVQGESPTGVIHYEIRKNSGYGFSGTINPLEFLSSVRPPAQIASSGTQQRRQASQQLAQRPAGPSVVIIEEEPPAPQPQVSVGGGGAMMIPIVINPLNSFITKKLLLDLAYT
jgi:murein DD-endopeptidase MepM/ murein hydrolase activator NlpD